MAICTEKIKDKTTGKMVDKKVDGKIQYYIRTYVNDEFGKKKQITRHNKEWLGRDGYWKAQQEENRLRNNFVYREEKEIPIKDITLRQLKEKYLLYLEGKIDDDTLKAKENKLNHFCEIDETKQVKTYPNKNIKKFDKSIYQIWQKEMKNKKYKKNRNSEKEFSFSIRHLNNIHNEISSMLDFGIIEGLCNINFAKQSGKIGTPKEIKMSGIHKEYTVIDFEEYKKLMKASENDIKFNTYFDLAFSRGPRPGEIRAFQIRDYNPIKKQLMVNHTMSKKNILKEPKTVSSKAPIDLDNTLNDKIFKLIEILKQNPNCNDEWFIFGNKNPISSHCLDYEKDKYFKIAGINKKMNLHNFRHSCATWLFSIGTPITIVSKILRHANIKETMKTYTHLLNTDYNNGIEAINEFKNNH